MPKNNKNPKSPQRQKLLNIIYFIDSNRTHSIKIPLRTASYLTAGLITLLVWSFVSSALLYGQLTTQSQKDARISQLLTSIFEYQTRYDGVYEKTYPKEQIASKKTIQDVQVANVQKPVKKTPADDKISADTPNKKDSSGAATTKLNPKSRQVVTTPKTANIRIQNPTYRTSKSKLTVSFAIQNKISPKRAGGRIWGVATVIDQKGHIKKLTSPKGILHKKEAVPENITMAQKFSIRYYKSKSLDFKVPKNSRITNIDIFCYQDNSVVKIASIPIKNKTAKPSIAKDITSPPKNSQ